MPPRSIATCLFALVTALLAAAASSAAEPAPGGDAIVPAAWLPAWNDPPAADRPLQIVHGVPPARASVEGMKYYRDLGLGGIVCNVAFDKYLQSEAHWKTLVAAVEACHTLGMVVWLYDEEGYPSGAAGGLVLQANHAFEARELAYDPSRKDPFLLRPAYEHTHASNNYHAARRYANLIDAGAVQCFIEKTHDAYWQRLQKHFGGTVQAFFTDEPSLMAVNLGQLPEHIRAKVRVADPLDPGVKALPCVPWCDDLPGLYRERYHDDLLARRKGLFEGDSPEDRQVRRQFWQLIADLTADRYFGSLQEWCEAHKVASSGHCLWEEEILHHVPLVGNCLKSLCRMDIPGLDVLSSDPQAVVHSGWLTAGLPGSAALLAGRRRVMTEVSDFSQKMGGSGPVGLAEMQATAAWQAAWGVTDFTLYYQPGDRTPDDYRAYGRYVGRLNAVLKPAAWTPRVLLYYPVYDLWSEYKPVAGPLRIGSQSPKAQRIVGSFMRLGQTLQRNQVPFAVVDHERVGRVNDPARPFRAIVIPEDCELPGEAAAAVDKFRQSGGAVLQDGPDEKRLSYRVLVERLKPEFRIEPAAERICLGAFSRDGRHVLLVVNVGRESYDGRLVVAPSIPAKGWQMTAPADGRIVPAPPDASGAIALQLAPREAVLLISSP